jgi:uncharacterized protein YkwD
MNCKLITRTAVGALIASFVVAGPAVAKSPKKVSGIAAASCQYADAQPEQATGAQIATATLCLMNAERTSRGLRALRSQATLAGVATRYARQMGAEQFFDHVSPSGSTLMSRIKASSYLQRAAGYALGENIAWGMGELSTPRETVSQWMHSAPHRANLLSSAFTEVGVGIATGGATNDINPDNTGTTYVTNYAQRTLKTNKTRNRH